MKTRFLKTYSNADVLSLRLPSYSQHCIMVLGEEDAAMHRQLCALAKSRRAVILNQFIFAGCRHYESFRKDIEKADWPISWFQGDASQSGELVSMQAVAVSKIKTRPIVIDEKVTGRWYEDDYARYCWLGNILPKNKKASREQQAYYVFNAMNTSLSQCDMHYTDIVRTWLFLDHILDWYDVFNCARTRFLKEHNVFEKMVPASTGIGAANPFGAALVGAAIAIKPKTKLFSIKAVSSPLQCSAMNYKSSFSRAVEAACPDHRFLYISGTASINAKGKSMYQGDASRQIEFTMQIVGALLKSRGMDWTDAFRGIVYFKRRQDIELFRRFCMDFKIPRFPLAISHAGMCREELLFEIELDAVVFY